MVVAFANNQVMVAVNDGVATISTDPVPLGGNDRAAAIFNVRYVQRPGGGGVTATIAYQAQVSNDGVEWVNVATLTDSATDVTNPARQVVAAVNGAYLRFLYTFSLTGASAGQMAGTCFDLHVNLDHA